MDVLKQSQFLLQSRFFFPPCLCVHQPENSKILNNPAGLFQIAFSHKTMKLIPLKLLHVVERLGQQIEKEKKKSKVPGFPVASATGKPMVKSRCTTESCLKPEREQSLCRTVCGAARCLCKNRRQYINSTVSAGYNSYQGKESKPFPRNLWSLE